VGVILLGVGVFVVSAQLASVSTSVHNIEQGTADAAKKVDDAMMKVDEMGQKADEQAMKAGSDATASQTDWTLYNSPELHFQMSRPSVGEVNLGAADYGITNQLGRIGRVFIWQTRQNELTNPDVVVYVYSTKAQLEEDFTSGGSVLGGQGLQKSTLTLNGATFQIYYGDHYCDGIGCTDQSYVAAEIEGATYSYMIEFYGDVAQDQATKLADPRNGAITQYLSSFKSS